MTKAQALAKARALWGRRAFVEDKGARFRDGTLRPATAESMEDWRTRLTDLRALVKQCEAERPLLASWPGADTVENFRAKVNAHATRLEDLRRAMKEAESVVCFGRRYQVGEEAGIGRFIRGEGHTWEEAFEAAGRGK